MIVRRSHTTDRAGDNRRYLGLVCFSTRRGSVLRQVVESDQSVGFASIDVDPQPNHPVAASTRELPSGAGL